MVISIVGFMQSTIALLLFATLGVFGAIDSVEVHQYGLSAERSVGALFSFADISYHNGEEWTMRHELGHLCHEDELGTLYLPIALVSSVYAAITATTQEEYLNSTWTERTAEAYGREIK